MNAVAENFYKELKVMNLTYGEVPGNEHEAQRLFEQLFLTRRIPSHLTFSSVGRRLQ